MEKLHVPPKFLRKVIPICNACPLFQNCKVNEFSFCIIEDLLAEARY